MWNIRSVNTQRAFTRLITMQKRHQFSFIGVLELFQDNTTIEEYKNRLGMKYAAANHAEKIWVFMEDVVECTVLKDEEQQLIVELVNQQNHIQMVVTLVYTKWSQHERLVLWESLEELAQTIQSPWLVGGDFNIIVNDE